VFLLQIGAARRRRSISGAGLFFFALALTMGFMTFSRASWVATAVVLVGALGVYRGLASRLAVMAFPLVLLAAASGFAAQQVDHARERIESPVSRESALSRLPVVYASFRMFEAKPVVGWGYGNFDRFDRQFQRPVGNLFYPDKDHASHNVYLTLLAEQGLIGLVLYLGPAGVLLARSIARRRRLPHDGLLDTRFVAGMWLVIAAHVVVNNFSRMQVPFGLGIWWLTLGLIATVVERAPAGGPTQEAPS
jgi:O-antigen ligase